MKANQKLKLARLENGLTIQEVAIKSGMEFCHYYCIEIGLITPNLLQIVDFSRILKLSKEAENQLIQGFIF